MTMLRFRTLLPYLFILLTTEAEAGVLRARGPVRSHFRESKVLALLPGQTRVDMGRSFIVAGSDSVSIGGRHLERETDYRINILRGTVILVAPAAGGELMRISWSRYPFAFAPVFASRFPGDSPEFRVTVPESGGAGKESGEKWNPYRLRLSGSKTVGFSVGTSRGLGIDQSLEVTMVGSLAKDLQVKAFLSDDNLPVQPEGNTEELKHLDKIYVQVNSRHMEVQLGDFSTGNDWSRFSGFERELRGGMVSAKYGGNVFHAGGGIAKGRFRTASFLGRDGVQGPYELLDARRFNGVIILPGTESVYLDGRELRRGSENDYTIDYNRGSVTFTEKLTISSDSEIVVDYQMGEDDYERTTLTGGWAGSYASGALGIRTSFFQEGDDSSQPVRAGLTEEELDILREAGDDPGAALAPGILEAEDSNDAYILVPADTLPAHYVFVETGGRYRLTFYDVGKGNGDYVTDGFTRRGEVKYAYAGESRGSYRIGRPLPMPTRKRVFSLGLDGMKGRTFLSAEGNISQNDLNTLSVLDDGDNDGGAMRISGGLRDVRIASSRLTLRGEYSSLEERFVSPDKTRESYFYRDWNLEDVPLEGREQISSATVNWRGDTLWDIAGTYSRLSRTDGLSARRSDISARIGEAGKRGIAIRALDSKTGDERDRRSLAASGSLAFWRLVPSVEFDTERYRAFAEASADTGRHYYQNTFSLAGRRIGRFRGSIAYSMRRTDMMSEEGGEWNRARENDEIRFEGGYGSGSSIIDLFLSHRTTREPLSGTSRTFDLARIRLRDSWESAGVTNDIGYRISSGEDRRLEKAVIYVGENQGDYDEEGREVGQKRGDYMVIYLPGGEVEAVRSVEMTWRTSVGRGLRGIAGDDGSGGMVGRIRRNVSVDHFFSVIEKSSTDELWRLYLLDPEILQRDDVTLYGKNSFRQEWSFLNDVRKYNLKLTWLREDEEDNRSEGLSVSRFNREVSLRAEAVPIARLSMTWEASSRLRENDSDGPGYQRYRVESVSASQVLGYRVRPSARLSFETGIERRRDEVSSAEQTSITATPSFNAAVGRKINISTFLKFTYTDVRADEGAPLFFLEEGLREDWALTGQYRFTSNVSLGVNYTGRREKDYLGEVKTVHALKMDCRAFF